jgi:lysophospholipase L1-like esterase
MKKIVKFWFYIGIFILVAWLSLRVIDQLFTNADGILLDINLNVFFQYIAGFTILVALCTFGLKSRYRLVSNGSLSMLSLLVFWTMGEIFCFLLIRFQLVDAPKPFHSRVHLSTDWISPRLPFWGDFSQSFGRWRRPDDSIIVTPVHGQPVQIRSNSFGMRDRERNPQNSTQHRRVALVGDSFVEGFIVQEQQRYSNLLENKTGVEHLNFGINGTSVINYYLIYKNLVKRFDHDVVLVSILPANDFEDYNDNQKRNLMRYPIYRPYWQGEFPNVRLDYSLADISQSLSTFANHDKPAQTQQVVDSVYRTLPIKDKVIAELSLNSYLLSCTFYLADQVARLRQKEQSSYTKEFFEDRWPAFIYSLEQLAIESAGKEVIFYTVPVLDDLKAYQKDRTDDLSPRLEKLCQQYGITYINLLPYFYEQGEEQWQKLYQKGDGHWTPEGEKFMAHVLLNHPAYRRAIRGSSIQKKASGEVENEPVYLSKSHEEISQPEPKPQWLVKPPSTPGSTAIRAQLFER